MEIGLPCGRVALIDDADWPLVAPYKLFSAERKGIFYVECRSPGANPRERMLLHKLLTGHARTDHRNGNGLDNRRKNLRESTHAQNMRNGKKRTDRPFKGVFQQRTGTWFAQLAFNRKRIYGGTFKTQEEAARRYDELAVQYHGEFARLNFPVQHVD